MLFDVYSMRMIYADISWEEVKEETAMVIEKACI
jgi:hypothetical protein